MNNYNELLAHYEDAYDDRMHLLNDHLIDVSRICREKGDLIGLGSICGLIGLLHDIGKCTYEFQAYLRGETKGRTNHSSAGAQILDTIHIEVELRYKIRDFLKAEKLSQSIWKLYKEILQYPILAHHGLYDIIDSDFNYRTGHRLAYVNHQDYKKNHILDYYKYINEMYIEINNESVSGLYYKGFIEFIEVREKLIQMVAKLGGTDKNNKITQRKALYFYYGALIRLLLSILKDGDIYNSSNYYRDEKDVVYSQDNIKDVWDKIGGAVEKLYEDFNKKIEKSQLDIVRTNLANEIYEFAQINVNGTYKLSMPVGSGKTYAGLRYAIANAKNYKKSRVFYNTAFLSVLEQNASSIKGVLGEELSKKYILEHHSNIFEDTSEDGDQSDEKDYQVNEYLKESWEAPLILTTLVQLSNTMFKDKSANIRRFSKLINSVIIIDEIQSLPTKAIYNFNLMTNFLANIMNCNIIHCTATQPNFDNNKALKYPCIYGGDLERSSITPDLIYSEVFDRVDYYNLLGESFDQILNTKNLIEHIKQQLKVNNSALIVLNTKSAVSKLYNDLLEDEQALDSGWEIIYLTTNQCPAHRLKIINDMKEKLKALRIGRSQEKLVCISTKLVEAGVDIDFDIVYRSLAGIDSIIQCGGRCNREGEKKDKGKLFIFEYGDESLRHLPDIRKQRDAARVALRVLKEGTGLDGNISIERALDHYFHKLYSNENTSGRYLEFPLEGNGTREETILNLLSTNPNMLTNYRNKERAVPGFMLMQGFKTAAINFDLIKEDTISVIAQYDNDGLIEELYEAIDCNDYDKVKRLLKRLQPYTVGIRRTKEYESYVSKVLDEQVYILNKVAYDDKVGLVKGELETLVF